MYASRRPFVGLLVTFLTAAWLIGCSDSQQTQGPPRGGPGAATQVVVEPVQITRERTRVEAVGTSRAVRSITLHPAVAGEVVAVNFKPGQYVEKGDVLVELDRRDEELAVELARVQLAEAERLYNRYQQSADSGATLPTTLDTAKTSLESARIELDRAQVALEDRTVKAPFAGYVGITEIDVGDRIQTSTAITTLDDRSSLLVRFDVPEIMVGKLREGGEVAISTWNRATERAMGEIIDVDSRIDPQTRTFVARARVNNRDDDLRPGMSFRVVMDLVGEPYPVLSEIALQWGADGSYVWAVNEGQVHQVPVNIIQRQQGRVLVSAQLTPDDRVVVRGLQRLRPNLPVEVTNEPVVEAPAAPVDNTFNPNGKGPG